MKKPSLTTTVETTGDDKGRLKTATLNYSTSGIDGKTDLMYAFRPDVTDFTASQSLKFKHCLAWISASLTGGNDDLQLLAVSMLDILPSGNVTIPFKNDEVTGARVAGEPTELSWDFKNVTKTFAPLYSESTSSPKTISAITANNGWQTGYLLPPQSQTQMLIVYKSKSTGLTYNQTIDLSAEPAWQAAKHYHYVIDLQLNSINFTCSIEDTDEYTNGYADPGKGLSIP